MKWTSVIIIVAIVFAEFGCTEVSTYWDEDDFEGINLMMPGETKEIVIGHNVTRYVETGNFGIRLRETQESLLFQAGPKSTREDIYTQNDEPKRGYCTVTAMKNLLHWYGEEISYEQAASELRTGDFTYKKEVYASCTAVCGGEALICGNICKEIVKDLIDNQGTTLVQMKKIMKNHTPPGYEFHNTIEDPSAIVEMFNQLQEGNPILVNGYIDGNPGSMHSFLLTGFRYKQDGAQVRVINTNQLTLEEFMDSWSLVNFGNDRKLRMQKRFAKQAPFSAMWYSKKEVNNGDM